ncbi:hypothetical protein AYL99_11997 [Fonsecaea erecta]|uniref:Uncharacterized protein n=1 Tax=Fonsecaea erecta TaxID=1367422 RepID=A0A178Z2S4_9EURO|nr:hypothetical protein AYL99_11997 [Fonsecaea erecta]OAP53811.1 hypothetical protein AYL99_11997 [Fonsecaea erecta]
MADARYTMRRLIDGMDMQHNTNTDGRDPEPASELDVDEMMNLYYEGLSEKVAASAARITWWRVYTLALAWLCENLIVTVIHMLIYNARGSDLHPTTKTLYSPTSTNPKKTTRLERQRLDPEQARVHEQSQGHELARQPEPEEGNEPDHGPTTNTTTAGMTNNNVSKKVGSKGVIIEGSNIGSKASEPDGTSEKLEQIDKACNNVLPTVIMSNTLRPGADPENKYSSSRETVGLGKLKTEKKTGKGKLYSDVIIKGPNWVLNLWTLRNVVMEAVPANNKYKLGIKIHNVFHIRKLLYHSPPLSSATGFEVDDDIFNEAESL